MAVTQVQQVTAGFAAGTHAPTFSTSPVAGNLLIMSVAVANSGGSVNSCSTPTGWTAGPSLEGVSGSSHGLVCMFYKVAAGGDANPSITFGPGPAAIVLEEYSGLATSSPVDITFTSGAINGVSGSVATSAGTTTNATDWIYCALGGRSASSLTVTWSGGQASDINYISSANSTCKISTSTQSVSATGSYTPGASLSSVVYGSIVAIAFEQASGSTPISVSDAGSGDSTLTVQAQVPVSDTGTGADAVTVAGQTPATDTGSGADDLAVAAQVPAVDTGSATDAVTVSAAAPLADSGSAVDALTVTVLLPAIDDTGSGADDLIVANPVALVDVATSDDELIAAAVVPLDDLAAAVDDLTVQALVPLSDDASAVGDLVAGVMAAVNLDDTGTGVDGLSHVVRVDLPTPAERTLRVIVRGRAVTVTVRVRTYPTPARTRTYLVPARDR